MHSKIVNQVCRMIAVVSLALASQSGHASVIIYDDFNGTAGSAVNPSLWAADAPPIVRLSGSSSVILSNSGAANMRGATGTQTVPTAPFFGRLTLQGFDYQQGNAVMGLQQIAASPAIFVRNDLGNGLWTVWIHDGASAKQFATNLAGNSAGDGTWQINWSTNGYVTVFKDSVLKLNTQTQGPDGGGAWSIPTAAMTPTLITYSSGISSFDSVTWETAVPEPSSVLLLGFGGMLLWQRRRLLR